MKAPFRMQLPSSSTAVERNLSTRRVRDGLHLSREKMARLLDISTRTVERWEERAAPPPSRIGRERLAKLQHLVDLGVTVFGAATFQRFLALPQPALGRRTPLLLIEQGEENRVYGLLSAEYEGQGF